MSSEKMDRVATQVISELNDQLSGQKLNPETFCILPFSHLSTTTIGEVRLCCRSENIGHIQKQSLNSLWRSEEMNEVRRDLIQGVRRPECHRCWQDEDHGIISLRKGQNIARGKTYQENVEAFLRGDTPSLPTLELKLSNRCNLRCLMCSPAASTRWMKKWSQARPFYKASYQEWVDRVIETNSLESNPSLDLYLSNPSFIEELTEAAADIRMLDFAGGEPLIDPLHYKVLRKILDHGRPELTTLRYSTNLTVLEFEKLKILDFWSRFKEVHLTISIDGGRELNAFIRQGTIAENLEANVREVKKLSQVKVIKGTTTLSALNSLFIDETIKYIVGDLGLVWHSSRLTSPDFLDARIWPEAARQAAMEKVRALDLSRLNQDQTLLDLSKRHIDDYLQWMSSSFEAPPRAIERVRDFCEALDPEAYPWFSQQLSEKGLMTAERGYQESLAGS